MRESKFQKDLKKEIESRFPGCMVLKNDADLVQGIPDLLVLYKDRWAALECKQHKNASHRPNQDWYVDRMNQMSYATFVYPENKEEVMNDLQHAFGD